MIDKKIDYISLQAEYFVPTYDLADKTRYVTRQEAYSKDGKKNLAIDVWLVQATKGQEQASMLESLQQEEKNYQQALKDTENDKALSEQEKKKRIDHFKHGIKLMQSYIKQYNDKTLQHKPDEQFIELARRNLAGVNCDIDKSVYVSGITHYEER